VLQHRAYVMGQFSRFIRPGDIRIDVSSNDSSLGISAFMNADSGAFAIVAVNATGAAVNHTFTLQGLATTTVTPWVTSATDSLAEKTPVAVGGGSFSYPVPATTVITFVGVVSPAPEITQQPATATIEAGGEVALSVTATGTDALSYQWRLNDVDIAGATASSYTIPSVQAFHAGVYTVVVSSGGASTMSAGAVLTVDAPAPSDARLLNLSTRGLTLLDNDIMIPGFVITGDGVKKLLVRVVGPRLDDFGLDPDGTLDDPQLVLRRILDGGGSEIVDSNDDWQTQTTGGSAAEVENTAATVGAFDFGADTKSAAVVVDVPAGQYGVISSGVGGLTGVVIAEVYDADETDDEVGTAKLVNLSNRGFVSTGDRVMIPGFVVSNEGPKTFLIRGVGPSLASVGFNDNLLADPQLSVFRKVDGADEFLFSNDDWGNNPDAANTAAVAATVGAFPLDAGGTDAALVVTLPPGVYSAVVSGVAATEGNALVEVYVVEQ
jgi:hypothetical protein